MDIHTTSANQTREVGKEFAACLVPSDVICLYGDLGSGKTTFVQGIMQGLGLSQHAVSPTFILVHEYTIFHPAIKKVYHVDLFRIKHKEEVKQLGITSLFRDKNAVTVIEWAEKAEKILPDQRLEIFFVYSDDGRKIDLVNKTGRETICEVLKWKK